MTTYDGSCHCKQVEWKVTLKPEHEGHILCHCNTCQGLSGAPYTLNQVVPKDALDITKGKDTLKEYVYKGDSGNSVHCYFCPNCTSHVYHHQEVMGPDTYVILTALLAGTDAWKPAIEIYGKDRLGWMPEVAKTVPVKP